MNQNQSREAKIPQDRIAERARKLWEDRGRPEGKDVEHWLDAERQIRDESSGQAGKGKPDLVEAEKRLDGLIEPRPSPARRTPKGEQL